MKEEITYEQAMERLQKLAGQMDRGELPIDKMASALREAQELIALCKEKLLATDNEIEKILASMNAESR